MSAAVRHRRASASGGSDHYIATAEVMTTVPAVATAVVGATVAAVGAVTGSTCTRKESSLYSGGESCSDSSGSCGSCGCNGNRGVIRRGHRHIATAVEKEAAPTLTKRQLQLQLSDSSGGSCGYRGCSGCSGSCIGYCSGSCIGWAVSTVFAVDAVGVTTSTLALSAAVA